VRIITKRSDDLPSERDQVASHFMPTVHDSNVKAARSPAESDDRAVLRDRVRSLRIPKSMPRRRGGWYALASALFLIIFGAACGYAYVTWWQGDSPPAADTKNAVSQPQASAPQSRSTSDLMLESKGYIIPAKQVLVSPKVSGMLLKLEIVEGQFFPKDFVLAELEDTDYQADCDRAAAALDAARQRSGELRKGFRREEVEQAVAELSEAEEQLKQYSADWDRAATLSAAHALSTEVRDAAESRWKATQQRVRRLTLAKELMEQGPRDERKNAAEAEVREAEAELAKAKWRLDNCKIRAPISGTILKKNAEEGNIVNPIAFNGSYAICEMADLSDMEVDLSIQERDISKVFKGQKCKIRAEAFPNRVYEGVVSRLMPIADRAKGAVPVRVKITIPKEEEGAYLKPEMGAIVSFFAANPASNRADDAAARTSQPEAAQQ
jgi:HlyD family secretion protein